MPMEFVCHHDFWHIVELPKEPEMNEIYEKILEEFK